MTQLICRLTHSARDLIIYRDDLKLGVYCPNCLWRSPGIMIERKTDASKIPTTAD
jgi:hypothetical protein